MKDTIKNSIIGAFAIFGFVALISSSNTAPTVIHEGAPESHVYEVVIGGNYGYGYKFNKETGEVWYLNGGGKQKPQRIISE